MANKDLTFEKRLEIGLKFCPALVFVAILISYLIVCINYVTGLAIQEDKYIHEKQESEGQLASCF